ncbi:MAG: tetratricopeptide repeat protein [Gammaproteobacteria bacterium]
MDKYQISLNVRKLMIGNALLLTLVTSQAQAGLAEGYAAYERGEFESAYAELLPVAEAGDVNAAYYLGLLYWEGQGVDKNVDNALVWLNDAAERGHTGAQLTVALAHERGQGVQQNYHVGAEWMMEAARGGNADAQYLLGVRYRDGRGVVQDHREALRWIERSVSGDRLNPLFLDSLLFLAAAREWGRGASQDLTEAYKWYTLAAGYSTNDARIYDDAVRSMDALSTRMAAASIAEAQHRAETWRSR